MVFRTPIAASQKKLDTYIVELISKEEIPDDFGYPIPKEDLIIFIFSNKPIDSISQEIESIDFLREFKIARVVKRETEEF